MAMIVQRVIAPASKLATVRALGQSTLASELGVEGVDEDDLYGALDWLLERQVRIEDRLARRHLSDGELLGLVRQVGEASSFVGAGDAIPHPAARPAWRHTSGKRVLRHPRVRGDRANGGASNPHGVVKV